MLKVEPKITNSGLHRRQALYHHIEKRGILVDTVGLEEAKIKVETEIKLHLETASKQWGKRVYVGNANSVYEGAKRAVAKGLVDKEKAKLLVAWQSKNEVNINSPTKFLPFLKDIGYKVPKITKKTKEGDYESEESTAELALRQLIRENQFNVPGGDKALIAILHVRELITLRNRYLNALLFPKPEGMVFLSAYNAGSGTLTGRRSSKKHIFGYGGNGQNIPSHSESAQLFRRCLRARPERIFLSVDQISAEDWPVNALAQNLKALDELRSGADRHTKLACFIFNLKEDSRTKKEWKESQERYLGKKTRHANNYGMKEQRFHDALMTEGRYQPVADCKRLLERANAADPSIQQVFHKFVQDQINATRRLVTPFGRERVFMGFRPGVKNGNLLNEAYSWIPQSVVGDNTGFAVEEIALSPEEYRDIVQEGHDSIVQEVRFDGSATGSLELSLEHTVEAFRRPITFSNGITVDIPVEAELAFDFQTKIKVQSLDAKGISEALQELIKMKEAA